MNNLTPFERSAIIIGVRTLVMGRMFDVCSFDAMAKLLNAEVGSRQREAFRLVHCAAYADMGKEIADQVKREAIMALGLKPEDVEVKQEPQPAEVVRPKLGFWRR